MAWRCLKLWISWRWKVGTAQSAQKMNLPTITKSFLSLCEQQSEAPRKIPVEYRLEVVLKGEQDCVTQWVNSRKVTASFGINIGNNKQMSNIQLTFQSGLPSFPPGMCLFAGA
ncbi:uncharacterized protein PGTG_00081 [Puccinia graminis f. sp. tritici CRL 75-36-700-3]|uniref:Uncharacterized protein n=1 Tax=Puccinia graminis f. sp. tritici (strain CRL 75-36-700-3 / race SCCL) TaxID=418459 RepID=E3JQ42_PUCGT|nr:uncharacterized protein PGTG_00081 [Puccinia graminis f. sp. tritici CRL 75-36-700-3]EFP74125.1 hypothetical protein PGTG_00081 [Puccinia graminis f. sp. tritici CRL 75-36-700-3]